MRERILVVEDDLAVLEVLKLMLEEHYDIFIAVNGMRLLSFMRSLSPM